MNSLLLIATLILGCHGSRIMHLIEETVAKGCPILEKGTCPKEQEITYWLTTSSTNGKLEKLDVGSLEKCAFIKGPLKIWFPGYMDNHTSPIVEEFIKGYLSKGQYNILVVDWYTYCNKGCYLQATQSIPAVGLCVGQFLTALLKVHPFNNFHLLGHSLGAHLASWATVNLSGVPRLTKFDPAMPLFTLKGSLRGNAKFIDVYHSNSDLAGQKGPNGDVDVYFNTATFQPGCKCDIACSHERCVTYYLESVGKKMMAFPCTYWSAYLNDECPSPKHSDLVVIGEDIDPKLRGIFMAFTKENAPFLENTGVYVKRSTFESFKTILKKEECTIANYASLVKDWVEGIVS